MSEAVENIQSEESGNLPLSWVRARLCEIAAINPTLDKSEIEDDLLVSFVPMPAVEAETGRIDVSTHRRFAEVKKGYTGFLEGDVLFAKITPCMENGKMAVVPALKNDLGFGSTEFHVLRPADSISPDYLYYFVSSKAFRIVAERNMTGAVGQRRVPTTFLNDSEIPLPSAAEQQRIVIKLDELFSELDKGVENLRTAQQQLKVYRQALLKHAFEGKLTADWRAQNPDKLESAEALLERIHQEREARYQRQLAEWKEAKQAWEANGKTGSKPTKPKEPKALPTLTVEELTELSELPDGWIYVKAEAISDFITKGTTPGKELLFDGAGEIPFIKVYNLTKTGALDFTISPTFVSRDTHNGFLARSKVYPGDVLMNIVGPPLGKVSIVPATYPEWNINQAIAIYRSELIQSKLLAAFLSSEINVRRMMSKSKATAGQFNLTLEICRDAIIPLCGAKEQEQLSRALDEKLSNLDQLEKTIADSLQQAESLRQSILKKAFSGQLVPQNPDDEPASVLLERIRSERSAQQPARKRGRKTAKPS
ncbi:restriction endonuclease subunit S [Aeromonas veronii]|uniref:restriction endonuclease subunit S n=1 Tax=Aeromonas veronii TaxID=654 RepID=UPI003D1AE7FD